MLNAKSGYRTEWRKNKSMEWDSNGSELLHTPGGVKDTYGAECTNRLKVQSTVHEVLNSYGLNFLTEATTP